MEIKRASKASINAYCRSGRIVAPWHGAEWLIIPRKGYVIQFGSLAAAADWIAEHEAELEEREAR